ncbi:MAG: hypothetical protein HY270_23305 [Deltaproteobacteria bacterium]|nr:hypothetical protein [Deltaproteobacteria bacterium]
MSPPPDAWLLGEARHELVDTLLRGFLGNLAALDWRTFRQLLPVLRPHGLQGLEATIGLALPTTMLSGMTSAVVSNLLQRSPVTAPSVLFARLTRCTAGHVIFRSQLVALAEGEFETPPLETANLLMRHTPSAVRAIFVGRVIRTRPDLDSGERQTLIDHATRHLHCLLDDGAVRAAVILMLRLAYYRLHHADIVRQEMQRLRIVDFRSSNVVRSGLRVVPGAQPGR